MTPRGLELLTLAATGQMLLGETASIALDAFTTDSALLAWSCACRAVRHLGARTCIFAVRWMLVTVPRLDLPLEVWATLLRETEQHIDAAEELHARWQKQARSQKGPRQ